MIYKYCRRCGKRLKGEENRIRGYGKICYEKAKASTPISPIIPIQLTMFDLIEKQSNGAESKAERGRGKEKIFSEKKQSREGTRPPHLEKTLTPNCKKPLIITPHTPPPPRR